MNSSNVWEKLKRQYLDEIADALESAEDTIRSSILRDVDAHLEQRRSELGSNRQTAADYGTIIQDMGPAEDYAELLNVERHNRSSCDVPAVSFWWLCLNRIVDAVFILLLFGVIAWTISAGTFLESAQ